MLMIKLKHSLTVAALAIALAALCGCGGGSDTQAGGGIGGSGVAVASVGTVTGFGSVIVNGVTYATQGAEIFIGNTSAGSGDETLTRMLSTGMVVRVEGVLNADGSATANRIFFNKDLKGPVESLTDLDAFTKQVVILGQPVVLDPLSVFRNATAADVAPGMVLEISGYADESGRLQTTYLNRIADSLPPGATVEIKSLVESVNLQTKIYTTNSLSVDFGAADLSGLPGGGPQVGQLINAIGRRQSPNVLIAERLELVEEFGAGAFETTDLEGIITRTGSQSEFAIGRYTVRTDGATVFLSLSPQDLNRGTRVIVRGALTGRLILADEIQLSEKIKIESDASAVRPVENSLSLSGMSTLNVLVTATTRIHGTAARLDQIQPGDHVRLLGRRSRSGDLFADSLLVTPSNPSAGLSGPVDSIAPPLLTVLGVAIDTTAISADRFRGSSGKPISPTEFFAMVQPGDIVSVDGVQQAGGIAWAAIAIE